MDTIDPEAVEKVFLDCLFRDDEVVNGVPTTEPVVVEGITSMFGFHPERLQSHRDEVAGWLLLLPVEFQSTAQGGGGGWSFLNACDDVNGNQWTGLHQRMEQLFTLGIALGLAKWQLPRKVWSVLPGGMPYVVVDIP
jgi:hypothetical protein